MREIKFRAWDSKEKCMVQQFEIAQYAYGQRYPSKKLRVTTQWTYYEEAPELVLMQYTGMTDKNGTDIYESDRLAIVGRPSKTGTVTWYNGHLYVQGDDGWVDDFMSAAEGDGSDYEVVGNIYEMPKEAES